MNLKLMKNARRQFVVFAVAAFIALTAAYAPMAIDELASTNLTPAAFACGHTGGGC